MTGEKKDETIRGKEMTGAMKSGRGMMIVRRTIVEEMTEVLGMIMKRETETIAIIRDAIEVPATAHHREDDEQRAEEDADILF
jgi:hypothetical protein